MAISAGGTLTRRMAALAVGEHLWLLGAVIIAAAIVLGQQARAALFDGAVLQKAVLLAIVTQAGFYYGGLYDVRVGRDRPKLFMRLVQALGAIAIVVALLYFAFPGLRLDGRMLVLATLLGMPVVAGWRILFGAVMRTIGPRERLLLVGTSPAAVDLARELYEIRDDLGVSIIGFIDPDPARVGMPVVNPGVIGTIEDIPSIVRARNIDRVVVSLADARGKLPMDKLLEMRLDGVQFDYLASVYERYIGKIALENLRPSWLIFSPGFHKSPLQSASKRLVDIVGAMIGLVAGAPLLLLLAVAVKLTSRGPVLYSQVRVGRDGRLFTVHKFRSMQQDAEAGTGPVWASRDDARTTWLGRYLRRCRLDETPQLWNVLRGQMSLVGPRPERPEFVRQLTSEIPFYGQRHIVRPGLTGWAQIRYTYGASVEDAMAKLQYDLFYVKHMSFILDLFIVAATVKTVLTSRGAA
jgi:sugar transferase (PEP-CTERM system associated)